MDLLIPLGLIGLIGIPILIIIYIIKPKYHKKSISSTYVWKLSLKYRKKKIPFQWLQKSLLLFIQILIVALIAILLAKPAVLVASKDGEKVVILDVSASMNTKSNDKTRLERALKECRDLASKANEENKLTIILGSSNPSYLVRRETSPSFIEFSLDTVKQTYEECNFDEALKLANLVIDENPGTEVLYYTDCQYEETGYVEVKDFSNNEWNIGILEFDPLFSNGYYSFKTKIGNYNEETNVKLVLDVDGTTYKKELSFLKDQELKVDFLEHKILDYKEAKITLLNSKEEVIDDSLNIDNEIYYKNLDNIKHNVQLVGYNNTFMKAALKSLTNVNLYVPLREEEILFEGQELYIFDGYLPDTLPMDGAVWILNPPSNINGLDLVVGNKVDVNNEEFWILESNNNTSEAANTIMKHLLPSYIEVTQYTKVSNYSNYEVLMNCDNSPVLLAGHYNNAKVIVLALDLSYTTLPISINMALLVNNVFDYLVNNTFDKSLYYVGEKVDLYSKPLTRQLFVNEELQMDEINYEDKISLELTTPGKYEVKQVMSKGEDKVDSFFVRISSNESNFNYTRDVLAIEQYVNLETGVVGNPGNDAFDYQEIATYFAAALLLLLIIEWGVQYREQY